jgi:predicted transcriptional regulator of viral defense system
MVQNRPSPPSLPWIKITLYSSDLMQPNQIHSQHVLTVRDAAAVLSVKPVTIRRLCQRGLLKRIPGIRHLRIAQAEMDRFIASSNQDS